PAPPGGIPPFSIYFCAEPVAFVPGNEPPRALVSVAYYPPTRELFWQIQIPDLSLDDSPLQFFRIFFPDPRYRTADSSSPRLPWRGRMVILPEMEPGLLQGDVQIRLTIDGAEYTGSVFRLE